MPGDSIQHDLEVTCPKCLQPYKDHKGDEAEVVCPPPPPRAMVTGGALLRFEPAVPPVGSHAVPVPRTAYALWLERVERVRRESLLQECHCGRYGREHSIGDGCGNFTPRPADDVPSSLKDFFG